MKLAMQHLSEIDGIGITQSIMFVIFFSIFLFILYYVYSTKKTYYNSISEMPLDDETDAAYSRNEIK
jgi:cbb3-type cytochrome oxidase subunit 3